MGYLHRDKEKFREAINLTYYQTGISTQAIEKDYYMTMILQLLSEKMPFIVLKGGTSLSKCYGAIKRFSEDIDISIERNLSQGQKKKLKYAVVDIAEKMGLIISNLEETRSRRDYNRYILEYDSVLPTVNGCVRPAVLMETSFTATSFPTVVLPVTNYIGKMMKSEAPEFLKQYGLKPFEMKVQGMNRTLVDKVFAVCDYYMQNLVKKHSRHLYDIYKLFPLVTQDDRFRSLVSEVRVIRAESAICPSAKPEVDIPVLMKRLPHNCWRKKLPMMKLSGYFQKYAKVDFLTKTGYGCCQICLLGKE